ncbi:MAG TPA: Nramp family divalent metal transporter [Gemmataceae bacterium]|nr:Nramp family divalent metal transporter [Gemmataceae bacterium]
MTHPANVPSLEEIHSSVPIPKHWWRRFLAFSGPAFMVSVGYMDPGNWGANLSAGSKYGHRLIWVLLMSNLMALLLQSLATRLGIVAGRDLAQACRESYPRRTVFSLWLLTEIAIAATDLAEVIGTIIALKLLFNIPYLLGLAIAAADTLLLLALQRRGVRLLEVLTLGLVAVIAGSFVMEIVLAQPAWGAVLRGFTPGLDPQDRIGSLYVAIAMLGATVMPHNLYLHSALVQTRAFPQTPEGKRFACKYNLVDSTLALNGAFFINAAIVVLAATRFEQEVETLQQAHELLLPVWGGTASVLFALALLASGQSSTLTGTLAGQVVMEGFVQLRVRPWVRRLLTRLAAIVPALLVLTLASANDGDAKTVDERLLWLLLLSQAILSFQLPFAIIPLVQFTSDPRRMGVFASPVWLKRLAWLCAIVVVGLNFVLIWMYMGEWGRDVEKAGWHPLWIYGTVGPIAVALAGFLVWVMLYPRYRPREVRLPPLAAPELAVVRYHHIGVAIEFAGADNAVLAQAAAVARVHQAPLLLIHVVEGPVAAYYGPATDDQESRADRLRMGEMVKHLQMEGLRAEGVLGYGDPPGELVRIARERQLDFLVLGTHGHRFFADLALGQTVSPVLHRLQIPILVVPNAQR